MTRFLTDAEFVSLCSRSENPEVSRLAEIAQQAFLINKEVASELGIPTDSSVNDYLCKIRHLADDLDSAEMCLTEMRSELHALQTMPLLEFLAGIKSQLEESSSRTSQAEHRYRQIAQELDITKSKLSMWTTLANPNL